MMPPALATKSGAHSTPSAREQIGHRLVGQLVVGRPGDHRRLQRGHRLVVEDAAERARRQHVDRREQRLAGPDPARAEPARPRRACARRCRRRAAWPRGGPGAARGAGRRRRARRRPRCGPSATCSRRRARPRPGPRPRRRARCRGWVARAAAGARRPVTCGVPRAMTVMSRAEVPTSSAVM